MNNPSIQIYTVGVCDIGPTKKGKPVLLSYLKYILPGQCIHYVKASNGTEAKLNAIKEHRHNCIGAKYEKE